MLGGIGMSTPNTGPSTAGLPPRSSKWNHCPVEGAIMDKNDQPIFIDYANASLKDDPEMFWQLYNRFFNLYARDLHTQTSPSDTEKRTLTR
jgi:hypothetical protein